MSSWILAIDFGTSYTVAAAKVQDRAPEIVEVAGERRMPSVVMVDPGGAVFVGRTAEDLSVTHPGATLRALKNRLGDQTPVILGGRPYQVVALVAALLQEVYTHVIEQMGAPPAEVRLTHPATWNQPRINRLTEAAAKAGLPNPLLVPEPVAAALSYAADVGLEPGRPIVVYDLGGGTFDSAVVTRVDEERGGGFAVIGRPGGDQHIGGELFDELVVNHLGEMLDPEAWEEIQVGDDPLWRQVGAALRNECRKAKEALSAHPYVDLLVPLPAGLWQVRLTRDEFHDLVRPYVAETIVTLERCVSEAGVRREDLAGISLVGGSSRSPIVAEMVRAAFPTVSISRRGDPKATVAAGATLAERPSSALPGVWRSPITQEASPGTAREHLRFAPPPISHPGGEVVQLPSDVDHRPEPLLPASPPPVSTAPVSDPPVSDAPVSTPPVVRAPVPGGPQPPGPAPAQRATPPAQPPTIALPISGQVGQHLQREPEPARRRSRKPVAVVVVLLIAAAATFAVIALRSDGDSSTTNDSAGPAPEQSAGETAASVLSTGTPGSGPVETKETLNQQSATEQSSSATGTEPTSGTDTSGTESEATDSAEEPELGTKLATLLGHKDEVLSASFSRDSQRLVTAGLDRLAIVWDLRTGEASATLAGHIDELYSAEFSPDGSMIATTGADRTVRLWDSRSGTELYTFTGHTDVVYEVSFSPDGAQLLSASRDRTARLWDIESGTQAAVFTGSAEAVYTAEFSPDGSLVVAGGQDDVVRVWSLSAPDDPLLLEGHTADVQITSFSPDQTLIVSASDDGTAKLWDAGTGQLIYEFGHDGGVWSASFSRDGAKVITSGADRTAKIWDVEFGDLLHTLSGHDGIVYGSSFSPDGASALTASDDGTARIWDVGTGAQIADLVSASPTPGAAFSPDGTKVVTVSTDGTVTIWAT